MNTDRLLVIQNWILGGSALITLASACIIVIGWRYTSRKDRENNIFLKRLEFRAEAFRSFIPIWEMSRQLNGKVGPEFINLIAKSTYLFKLYCDQDEIDALHQVVDDFNNALHLAQKSPSKIASLSKANDSMQRLNNLIIEKTRSDIAIKPAEFKNLPKSFET